MDIAAALLCIVLQQTPPRGAAGGELSTGGKVAAALNARLSGAWLNEEFRPLLNGIGGSRRIAILLDRRIDPNRVLTYDPAGKTVREGLAELAESAEAAMTLAGNTVVIAPAAPAGRLRTLIQLRSDEIGAAVGRGTTPGTKSQLFSLAERNTVRWGDLDEPRGIVEKITARWKLAVDGLDQVPHDLWAAAALPDANASEALSLVLNQFDLTFQWTDGAAGIRIVPVPATVALEKRHAPRGSTAAEAVRAIEEARLPGVVAEVDGREVKVRGTVEQHEAVDALLKPGGKPSGTKPVRPAPGQTPLARRTFTLKTKDAPASAVLDKLRQSGIDIRCDAAKLKSAGVDLDGLISLDLTKASTKDLFEAICAPVGAKFTIEGETVTISAK